MPSCVSLFWFLLSCVLDVQRDLQEQNGWVDVGGVFAWKKSNKSERVTPSAQKIIFLLEREKKGEKEERKKKRAVMESEKMKMSRVVVVLWWIFKVLLSSLS